MLSPRSSDQLPLTSTPVRRVSASVLGVSHYQLSPVLNHPITQKINSSLGLTQSQGYVSLSSSDHSTDNDTTASEKLRTRILGGRDEGSRSLKTQTEQTSPVNQQYRSNVLPSWIHKLSQELQQQQITNKMLVLCLYFTQFVTCHYKRQQINLQKKLELCQEQVGQLQVQTKSQLHTIERIETNKEQLRRKYKQLSLTNKARLTQQRQREDDMKVVIRDCQHLMERQQQLLQHHYTKLQELEKGGSVAVDIGLLLFTLYISKTHLVQQSMKLLISRLTRSPRNTKRLSLFLRWLYVVEIMILLRCVARKMQLYKGFNGLLDSLWSIPGKTWKLISLWKTQPD